MNVLIVKLIDRVSARKACRCPLNTCFVKTLWKVSRLFHPFVGPTSIQDTQFSISDKMLEGLKIRFALQRKNYHFDWKIGLLTREFKFDF